MIAEREAAGKRLAAEGDIEGHSIQANVAWLGGGPDGYARLYLTVKATNMVGEDQTVLIALNEDEVWRFVSNLAARMAEVR